MSWAHTSWLGEMAILFGNIFEEVRSMGKKMPKYAVFNVNVGREYHEVVETGDDLDDLLVRYHGKGYQVMAVKPVFEREEW